VLQEPVFRVLVSLDEPTFSGQPLPLIAGMTLQADIQLELRSVLEWILEPLLAWEARV
jgi:membrane fusion protein